MSDSVIQGPWWPNWVEQDLCGVGITLRGRYWRLVDLCPLATGAAPTIFGSKFEQYHYAAACAAEEWEQEQLRRIEATLPLGARPGFLAFRNGAAVAGGRLVSDARRRARNGLPSGRSRAERKRIEIAPASQAAMQAWEERGAAAPIVRKSFSRHQPDPVVLTFDEAEKYSAAFADRIGWVTHDLLKIGPFGATEDEAWERGVAAHRGMFGDDCGELEICEATAAGRDLLQAGVNLRWEEVTDWPRPSKDPEFVDGEVYRAYIPGQDVYGVVCCSSAEARALYEIRKLIPAEEEDRCPIRVDLT